jgi:hypothetical protein
VRRAHSCKCTERSTQGAEKAGAVKGSGLAFLGCWVGTFFLFNREERKGREERQELFKEAPIMFFTVHCVLKYSVRSTQGAENAGR